MKEKFTNTINIIKSSKRSRYMFIATIMLIFISVIGFSLSLFTNNNSKPIANIKVNGLSFNITTNTGESDDRILRLQAGKTESFTSTITNLNKIGTKCELIYDVCSDSNCTSIDKIYLLSSPEIGDTGPDTASSKTRLLDYYKGKNNNSRIKDSYWWLRNAWSSYDYIFIYISSSGGWADFSANVSAGFSPAFRIG